MRGRSILVALAVLALGALAYFGLRPVPPTSPTSKENVTVAQVGDFFLYLPLYYANDRGYFERQGLSVKIVNSGGDEKSVAAVLAGSAQFGVGDPTFAAVANEKGQGVRVIASVVNGVPFWGVSKRSDIGPITDPKQLSGLRVATFPKPSTAFVLQEEMFEQGGLKPNIVQAQFGALLPLLDNKGADVVLELEPNVATAEASGAKVVYSLAKSYPDFAITGVTVSESFYKSNPKTVRAFVVGLEDAVQAAHKDPADLIAYARTKFANLPAGVVESAAKRMLAEGTFPRSTKTSSTGWQKAVDLRVDSGDLKTANGIQTLLSWPLDK